MIWRWRIQEAQADGPDQHLGSAASEPPTPPVIETQGLADATDPRSPASDATIESVDHPADSPNHLTTPADTGPEVADNAVTNTAELAPPADMNDADAASSPVVEGHVANPESHRDQLTEDETRPEWVGTGISPFVVTNGGASADLEGAEHVLPLDRPDIRLDGSSSDWVTVRAASARGRVYRYYNKQRDDDYALLSLDSPSGQQHLIAVVCDGVSAPPLSYLAATAACRSFCQRVSTAIYSGVSASALDWQAIIAAINSDLTGLASDNMRLDLDTIRSAHAQSVAATRLPEDLGISLMATTLLGIVAWPAPHGGISVAGVNVGDCSLWTLGHEGEVLIPRAGAKEEPEDGVASGAVCALPTRKDLSERTSTFEVDLDQGEALFILSDGVGDAIGQGQSPVGRFIAEVWRTPPNIYTFGAQVDVAYKGFDDDRTAIGLWSPFAAEDREQDE